MIHPDRFLVAAADAFSYLVDTYDYGDPATHVLGREVWLEYLSHDVKVSVTYEIGANVMVELSLRRTRSAKVRGISLELYLRLLNHQTPAAEADIRAVPDGSFEPWLRDKALALRAECDQALRGDFGQFDAISEAYYDHVRRRRQAWDEHIARRTREH